MSEQTFPKGWDQERVQGVLTHYADQSEDEAVAEDEAAFVDESQATVVVPKELVPEIEALIARHQRD